MIGKSIVDGAIMLVVAGPGPRTSTSHTRFMSSAQAIIRPCGCRDAWCAALTIQTIIYAIDSLFVKIETAESGQWRYDPLHGYHESRMNIPYDFRFSVNNKDIIMAKSVRLGITERI
jgi:hypothetical protein